jgi:elongation factor P hydroxylase
MPRTAAAAVNAVSLARCTAADNFQAQRLEEVFARCFSRRWRTRLVGGADEPSYQPATDRHALHVLHYRSDYFASALHETAHWCIAGERRRQLPDFGYWYAPDGRDQQQQLAFEAVEARPQALEWLFSLACGYRFRISVDNLGAPGGGARHGSLQAAGDEFCEAVAAERPAAAGGAVFPVARARVRHRPAAAKPRPRSHGPVRMSPLSMAP